MPTTKVLLGHNQKFKVDGVAMEGTRDVDVTIDARQHDVTPVRGQWVATLPLAVDLTLKATLYWAEDFQTIWDKFMSRPPEKFDLEIDGVMSGPFVATDVRIANPMGNVVAWDVTFKQWVYG